MTVHVCKTCLDKHNIGHDAHCVDVVHECFLCRITDKTITLTKNILDVLIKQ